MNSRVLGAGRRLRWGAKGTSIGLGVMAVATLWISTSMGPSLEARMRIEAERTADLQPLDLAEIESTPAQPPRTGELAIVSPAGCSLDPRPTLVWKDAQHRRGYHVVVRSSDGELIWERVVGGSRLPYPKDAPSLARGESVQITVSIAGKPESVSVGLRTASIAEVTRFERARADLIQTMPEELRELALAHLALRAGVTDVAYAAARAADARHPDDPYVRATLDLAATRLGLGS